MDYQVKLIDFNNSVKEWISSRHYTQTCPVSVKYTFGLFDKNIMIGACLISQFSRMQSRQKYSGCLELSRVFIEDVTKKNAESFFIGSVLRWLKSNTNLIGVISYADSSVGHYGIIYQATNFKLIGQTGSSYHYELNGKRINKKQVWDRAKKNGILEKDQARNENLTKVGESSKYIYFYSFDKKHENLFSSKNKDNADVSIHRKKFFSKWTKESAWIYGLILGDGHIHLDYNGGVIMFCGTESTVNKFNNLLLIKKPPTHKRGVWHTYFNDKNIAEWFRERGVGTKKTKEISWPKDIADTEYVYDFLRGLFDSDGSFGIEHIYGRKVLRLGFSSSNRTFIENFCYEIERIFNFKKIKITINSKFLNNETFIHNSISFSEKRSFIILDRIYKDSSSNLRDDDRHQKYIDCKKSFFLYHSMKCKICGDKMFTNGLCKSHFRKESIKNKRSLNKCSIEGCSLPYHGSGFCMKHLWDSRKKSENRDYIGKKILEIRTCNKINQNEFGKLIGLSQHDISRIEIGKRKISEDHLNLICSIFKKEKEFFTENKT